ncbi:hypothetical protein FHR32_000824 [Streptosporangium album]|uniref:Amine oxidase domain-containing protein n=1 Tax=Streptosporangium album TaxID=47479 RepID=A0A7W7RQW6_9ACTN|nr:reverse transcriptase domain-containing protein [Streptosporangium album]MBB4936519.1 hypothetical protein [Streptosporangium album]
MRADNGAPGIDRTTLDQIEHEYEAVRLVDEPAAELQEGRYRPLPARGVMIPKPGRAEEYRPLSISTVRDRVVQAALKIVLEPVFEADFATCSFGFRPKRATHDALQVVIDEAWRGRRWVVEHGVIVRFADDLLVMCRSRQQDRHHPGPRARQARTVVEARERTGGSLWTKEIGGATLELSGQWVSPDQTALIDMIEAGPRDVQQADAMTTPVTEARREHLLGCRRPVLRARDARPCCLLRERLGERGVDASAHSSAPPTPTIGARPGTG